jgi:hypothetical protein
MTPKFRAITPPNQWQDANRLHRRIDEVERLIQSLSLLGAGATGGLASGSSSQNCGLTFNPATVSIAIPADTTGTASASVQVTSSIAQTVTFTASWAGTPDPCLGTPTVVPSTVTFTAGQTVTIVIQVPYYDCGLTVNAQLTVAYTTNQGCSGYMGGGPGQAGTASSNNGNQATFVIDPGASESPSPLLGCCGCGSCPDVCECCVGVWDGSVPPALTLRSLNGWSGTVVVTCTAPNCVQAPNIYYNCAGYPQTISLPANGTASLDAPGGSFPFGEFTIEIFGNCNGPNSTLYTVQATITATGGGITRNAIFIYDAMSGHC